MSGPAAFERRMKQAEDFLNAPTSWDELVKSFAPAAVPEPFEPGDEVAKFLAQSWQHRDGRAALDWIFSLTIDAPYPHVSSVIEQAAFAAKAHEARAAVGLVILRAIAAGEQLLEGHQP